MKISECPLHGVLLIEPRIFKDSRGFFFESFQLEKYSQLGTNFVQDNVSSSHYGTLRGLHFQNPNPQAKLIQVLSGEVFDVVVDLRSSSQTFGKWFGIQLDISKQLFVPEGFAHGFVVTTESAVFSYKCSAFYNPASEVSLMWDDPVVSIQWPALDVPFDISPKDRVGLSFDAIKVTDRFF